MLLILKGRPACGPPERVPVGGPSHGPPDHKPKLPVLREAAPCKLNNEKKEGEIAPKVRVARGRS